MTADPIVRVSGFGMAFGETRVVRELSFDVERGETFGFLGSNGSGKTTTLRALLGIYEPTEGELLIGGERFRPGGSVRLGYLPEERGLLKKERVIDTMAYFGRLKGMTRSAARAWSLDYLERVGLGAQAMLQLDKLSGGQQQKVQLGVTIMADPELLILDEPTKGFDPVNRRLLLDLVEERKRAGATVMMVTHQMDEVERLCDRIIMLRDGTAFAYGTVADVQDRFGGTTLQVRYDAPDALPALSGARVLADQHGQAELALEQGADPAALLAQLVGAHVAVTAFTPQRRSMESIFVEVYGERVGE